MTPVVVSITIPIARPIRNGEFVLVIPHFLVGGIPVDPVDVLFQFLVGHGLLLGLTTGGAPNKAEDEAEDDREDYRVGVFDLTVRVGHVCCYLVSAYQVIRLVCAIEKSNVHCRSMLTRVSLLWCRDILGQDWIECA